MSHLNEPMIPANNEREEDRPTRCEIIPPYTEHPPCGMPGCGKAATGKWAEPIFYAEIRPIDRSWGGLSTAVYPLVICESCFSGLGNLAMDAYLVEEEAAAETLKAQEE